MDKQICEEYLNYVGIRELSKKYHIGALKVKKILLDNGIELRDKNSARMKHEYVINDYRINKYPNIDGYQYVAVLKDDSNIKIYDHMNRGGHLTSYIEKKYNIPTPTLYDRREYYKKTGNYWWEQWFDIIKEENKKTKKCPYCDWETVDVDNNSGAFLVHLNSKHNINIDEYLNEHPEDSEYFKKQKNKIEKKKKLLNDDNFVTCPICNEKFEKITYWHLLNAHNINYQEFREKYGDYDILSKNMHKQCSEMLKLGNLTVSKKRFISKYENELQELLKKYNIDFDANRQILIGKEIDILVEEKKIGIEFDGLKFHTEWFGKKKHDYHLQKTLKCNEKGYGLIHIFEDEYVYNKEIVENKILHILGVQLNCEKIAGRKCVVKEIYKSDAETFLNKYHIQGFSSASVYYGAFYKNELIAVMTFKNGNLKNQSWELTRFASNYNYICQGIGGKMFKHFVKEYNPIKVISFADRRWTVNKDNNIYTKLGFSIEKICQPDYKYYNEKIDRYKRIHKMNFNKKKLSKKYGFPLTMTETEMAKQLGYDRIWDCGLIKYEWVQKKEE